MVDIHALFKHAGRALMTAKLAEQRTANGEPVQFERDEYESLEGDLTAIVALLKQKPTT